MKQPGKPKNIASRGAEAYEHEGWWVPVPPAHLGDDLDEWNETCPRDRLILFPDDDEARCHRWEWVDLEPDQQLVVEGVEAVAVPFPPLAPVTIFPYGGVTTNQ